MLALLKSHTVMIISLVVCIWSHWCPIRKCWYHSSVDWQGYIFFSKQLCSQAYTWPSNFSSSDIMLGLPVDCMSRKSLWILQNFHKIMGLNFVEVDISFTTGPLIGRTNFSLAPIARVRAFEAPEALFVFPAPSWLLVQTQEHPWRWVARAGGASLGPPFSLAAYVCSRSKLNFLLQKCGIKVLSKSFEYLLICGSPGGS